MTDNPLARLATMIEASAKRLRPAARQSLLDRHPNREASREVKALGHAFAGTVSRGALEQALRIAIRLAEKPDSNS